MNISAYAILVIAFISSFRGSNLAEGSKEPLLYFALIALVLAFNYFIARESQVQTATWIKRTLHLLTVPIYYVVLSHHSVRNPHVLNRICHLLFIIGLVESGCIYYTYLSGSDQSQEIRATSFYGMIIYSVMIVYAMNYSLEMFSNSGRYYYLLLYSIILTSTLLTASRILVFSGLILLFKFALYINKRSLLLGFIIILAGIVVSATDSSQNLAIIERWDLSVSDNTITIYSKISEINHMIEFFKDSPVIGVGYGHPYQTDYDAAVFDYSHNWVFFNLGYGGILGLAISLYPILRLLTCDFKANIVPVAAIVLFYTSSTTYTNLKHSLLIALILVIIEHFERTKRAARHAQAFSSRLYKPAN